MKRHQAINNNFPRQYSVCEHQLEYNFKLKFSNYYARPVSTHTSLPFTTRRMMRLLNIHTHVFPYAHMIGSDLFHISVGIALNNTRGTSRLIDFRLMTAAHGLEHLPHLHIQVYLKFRNKGMLHRMLIKCEHRC